MKEILYIARIDGRPWKRIKGQIDSLIPFVMFFASIEMTSYLLNGPKKISDFERYFIIAIVVVIIVYLGDFARRPWRATYITKWILDIFCCALVSSALFNASAPFLPTHWELNLYKLGIPSDALLRVVVAFTISSFGLIYLIWRTETNRREEFLRLAARPSSQRFLNFRRKERRCLIKIYIVDYILVGTLTASLLVATR